MPFSGPCGKPVSGKDDFMAPTIALWAVAAAAAYSLGSVPVGLIVTRWYAGVDVRRHGSGNIGATNVRRIAGNGAGFLTLIGDIAKGAVPVILVAVVFGGKSAAIPIGAMVVGLAAVFGHLFPVWLRFRPSGKGVATMAGAFGAISPPAVLMAAGVFLVVTAVDRRVSVGSMAAVAFLPLAVWWQTGSPLITGGAALIALVIIARHRDNIRRIKAGTEPRLGRHPK